MINQIVFVSIAYLIGSLSFGIIVSKFLGSVDPRTIGSKNPGATNVMRGGNKVAAILTLSGCLLYTSPSPRDVEESRMPSSA